MFQKIKSYFTRKKVPNKRIGPHNEWIRYGTITLNYPEGEKYIWLKINPQGERKIVTDAFDYKDDLEMKMILSRVLKPKTFLDLVDWLDGKPTDTLGHVTPETWNKLCAANNPVLYSEWLIDTCTTLPEDE